MNMWGGALDHVIPPPLHQSVGCETRHTGDDTEPVYASVLDVAGALAALTDTWGGVAEAPFYGALREVFVDLARFAGGARGSGVGESG